MVIDASVSASWYIPSDRTDRALEVLGEDLAAPDIIISETMNAIWKAMRFGAGEAEWMRRAASDLPQRVQTVHPSADLAPRAAEFSIMLLHPVYDCFYLALAERLGERLATADRKLIGAVNRQSSLSAMLFDFCEQA